MALGRRLGRASEKGSEAVFPPASRAKPAAPSAPLWQVGTPTPLFRFAPLQQSPNPPSYPVPRNVTRIPARSASGDPGAVTVSTSPAANEVAVAAASVGAPEA